MSTPAVESLQQLLAPLFPGLMGLQLTEVGPERVAATMKVCGRTTMVWPRSSGRTRSSSPPDGHAVVKRPGRPAP